ncbi:MAG TPA: glycosyl hydrolase [Saprospirales bacterium]|nr:glycosyl hydrolase [Saprospirales bacterium]HAY71838.1 glycosyl hydrolase [Saprospirales bacterium]HRQ30975.1 T9SS type A sorting domain-containing protein [Saprospiraceae bacterium]
MNKKYLPLLLWIILAGSGKMNGQHQNIEINSWGSPNEPTIMIDPQNPDIVVAASNLNLYYYSSDGGKTWTVNTLTSPYGVWGDPVMVVDTAGHFYFFHLSNPPNDSWIDRIVCQKSIDGGKNWSSGTFMGKNGSKAQDKHWAVVDRNNNNIYVTWTQFDKYGSTSSQDSSHIMFSMSTDGGDSWMTAKRINNKGGDCIDSDGTVEGAVPAVGPDGEIYVSWAAHEKIYFDKSFDRGQSWLEQDQVIAEMPGGWDVDIPGIMRSNGFPVTLCDLSGGPAHGTIYINWADQRNGINDTDIWLIKSVDQGETWSQPVRVNDDPPGKHQFFTWMTIDQTNGYIYIVYYDRSHYADNQTDVVVARSTDGGATFKSITISESPFYPIENIFFGDYNNISAHGGVVRPIWTRLHNGKLSLHTALVDLNTFDEVSIESTETQVNTLEQNYPNPFSDTTYISFKIPKESVLSLDILDTRGNHLVNIFRDRTFSAGQHIIALKDEVKSLPSGTYIYTLKTGDQIFRKKMVSINH